MLSAPSGGGKSTIADAVLKAHPQAVRSVSYTTRPKRPGEKQGKDYFFTDARTFKKKVKQNHFLEWARVHEHFYGTPLKELLSNLKKGKDVLLVIDPQGAMRVRKAFPKGLYIFILPPTWKALKSRLNRRGTDDRKTMSLRLKNARKELKTLKRYNYFVVNDRLDRAVKDVVAIIRCAHLHLTRLNKKAIPILN